MEIVIELPKDIDKLCRTCMNIVDDHKNCVKSADNSELNKMLLYLIGATISSDDCLPKFMCSECVKKLEIAYMFKQQCQNTYLNFRDFMDSTEDTNFKTDNLTFICSTCNQCFPTQYKLSKHEIIHYKNINLFTRFRNGMDSDFKTYTENCEEEILSLISERKKQTNEEIMKNERSKNVLNGIELIKEKNILDKCDLCNRKFDTSLSLHLHFVNHALLAEGDTSPDIFNQYFLCRICGETFGSCEDLDNHATYCYVENDNFHCSNCNQTFNSELLLLRHEKEFIHCNNYLWGNVQYKTNEMVSYTCPICNDEFTTKSELHLHSVSHIIKQITCRMCKKTFSCQIAHNNHLKSHPNYKHMCDQCGRWLASRHALKIHMMGVHSANKNFVCSVCSKAFKTPSRLYVHKLTHKEEKKFICSICNYKTNNVGDFKIHHRTHTSERPYKCNFVNCKRRFKTSSHLNEHIQRHLQIKKYRCNMCCMVFGHNHTLKMHLLVHTGEKPFSCNICKVKFRRKHHLKNHMKQHVNIDNESQSEKL